MKVKEATAESWRMVRNWEALDNGWHQGEDEKAHYSSRHD